jgi:hypothetical protein
MKPFFQERDYFQHIFFIKFVIISKLHSLCSLLALEKAEWTIILIFCFKSEKSDTGGSGVVVDVVRAVVVVVAFSVVVVVISVVVAAWVVVVVAKAAVEIWVVAGSYKESNLFIVAKNYLKEVNICGAPSAVKISVVSGLLVSVLVDSTEDASNVDVFEASTSTSVVWGAEVDDDAAVYELLEIGLDWISFETEVQVDVIQ